MSRLDPKPSSLLEPLYFEMFDCPVCLLRIIRRKEPEPDFILVLCRTPLRRSRLKQKLNQHVGVHPYSSVEILNRTWNDPEEQKFPNHIRQEEQKMKTILLILFNVLLSVTWTAAGPPPQPQNLSASLDSLYPPQSGQPEYLLTMLQLDTYFSGIMADLMEDDRPAPSPVTRRLNRFIEKRQRGSIKMRPVQ